MTKYVYAFQEGNKDMRDLLGGKGANLAEMVHIGLPVPDGFTVTTEACNEYYQNNETISEEVKKQILKELESIRTINLDLSELNRELVNRFITKIEISENGAAKIHFRLPQLSSI